MNIVKKIRNNSKLLFFIAFSINSVLVLIGGSKLININNYIKYFSYGISILLLLYVIYSQEKSKKCTKKDIIIILFAVYSIYSTIMLKSFFFIMNLLIMLAVSRKDLKNILVLDISIKLIFIMLHIIATIIVISNGNASIVMDVVGNRSSCTFFYKHYNIFAGIVSWMIIEIIYIKSELKISNFLIFTIIEILLYKTTTSKTALLVYIIFVILFFIIKNCNNKTNRNLINIAQRIGIEIVFIFSFLTALLYKYKNPFIYWLNRITSGRIYYSAEAIKKYGVNIFPNTNAINLEYYIDNFYIRSTVLYGLLFIFILCVFMKKVKKEKYYTEKVLLITYITNLFSEYFEIIIGNACPLLILGSLIKEEKKKEKKPKELVSVIIPVYNVEKYLKECVNSILKQTYRNIELILIDDGSTDSSPKICDNYRRIDNRVIVIHQNNSGVSSARNKALDIANGEYITFIDADDIVKNTYIEDLLELCEENNCDISICGFADKSNKKISENKNQIEKKMSQRETLARMLDEKNFYATVWGKMFKKEIIKEHRFDVNLNIGEDLAFISSVLLKENLRVYVNTELIDYYYRIREDSITREKYNENWKNEIKVCENIIEETSKIYPQILEYAIKRYVRINYSCIIKILKNTYDEKEYHRLKKNITDVGVRQKYKKFNIVEKLKIWIVINRPEFIVKNN